MAYVKTISIYIVCLLCGHSIYGLEKVRLQLKWLHQFQFAGYYAAIEQGYYKDVGLEVELLEVDEDLKPTQSVLDGRADFGVCGSDVLLMRARGEPVVALAAVFQHSPHVFAAIEGEDIESVHDLAGKRVMMEPSSADLLALLQAEQLPLDSIEFVRHSFSPESLYRGDVDAMSAYITDEPFEIRRLGKEPAIFSPRSAGIDFYGDVLFTTEAFLESHPDTVASFRFASLQGWKYAVEHPENVIDWILKKYSTRKSREALQYEAKQTIDLIRPNVVEIGYMHRGRWAHMTEVFQSIGMIDAQPDLDAMLYRPAIPFGEKFPVKTITISILCLAFVGLLIWKQRRNNLRLEAAINRREESDSLLRKRESEYRALFTDAPLAFIVWDTELRIREWNHEAEKLFGWSAEEVVGTIASDFLVPETSLSKVESGKAKLLKQPKNSQINENYTKDGRIIWCQWNNVARKNAEGEVIEFHSIAVDVTEEVSEKLRLEEEYTQILNANKSKDLLLAHTSHEIRNPLNAIMGFTQMILSDAKDDGTREMAKIVLEGTESMLEILNDLLDNAKLEAGKMVVKWSSIYPKTCVEKTAKLLGQSIANKGLEFKVSITDNLPKITSDPRYIQQILRNLLSNARKFTNKGSVEISVTRDGSDHVRFAVQDSGIGMDAATLESVFQPYSQAYQGNDRVSFGTGLGLSVARKMTEQLGGTLTARSRPGEGSCFTLRLPVRRNASKDLSL